MAFWIDDLDAFFSDFAIDALWKGVGVKCIFHNEHEAVALFSGEVESANPYVEVKSSDVEGVAHGDSFEVNGTEYSVAGIRPDSTGITVLILLR